MGFVIFLLCVCLYLLVMSVCLFINGYIEHKRFPYGRGHLDDMYSFLIMSCVFWPIGIPIRIVIFTITQANKFSVDVLYPKIDELLGKIKM